MTDLVLFLVIVIVLSIWENDYENENDSIGERIAYERQAGTPCGYAIAANNSK